MREHMDVIEVNDLRVDCIVGVLEREQRVPQRLVLDLRLFFDVQAAGDTGDLARTVDYAKVAEQVALLAEHGRFRLLESLAVAICRMLLAPPTALEERAPVERIEVVIRKPDILADRCVPGLRMVRDAGWCRLAAASGPQHVEECIVDLPEGGAWRVVIEPGGRWDPADRAALVLAGDAGARPGHRLPRGGGPVTSRDGAVLIAVGTRRV